MSMEKYPKIKYALDRIIDHQGQFYRNLTDAEISADGDPAAGTSLDASVTANASFTEDFNWTIAKSVTPTELNLFNGAAGTASYIITVTKGDAVIGSEQSVINGNVTVSNTGDVATEGLAITVELTNPSGSIIIVPPATVDVSGKPVLASGESHDYAYSITIPSSFITADATYKVTAHVTITNHSGSIGTPTGPSPSNTVTLPNQPSANPITVTDTNPDSGPYIFTDSGSQPYSVSYKCPDDAGDHTNTATIVQTGQTASATITVRCIGLVLDVTKDANTALTRTYNWNIAKSADKNATMLQVGQSDTVNYTVVVNETPVDSNWAVSGVITISNTTSMPITITKVTDVITPGNISATLGSFPTTVPANGQIEVNYNAVLPDSMTRINTATVTAEVTPGTTIDFIATVNVIFDDKTTITEVNKCVKVEDTLGGELAANLCAGVNPLPATFTYSHVIGPFTECGEHDVTNTSEVISNDPSGGVLAQNDWTVHVHVPCRGVIIKSVM